MTPQRWLALIVLLAFLALALLLQCSRSDSDGKVDVNPNEASTTGAASAPGDDPLADASRAATHPTGDATAELSRQFRFRMTCARVASGSREMERQFRDPNSWINNDDVARQLSPEILTGWQKALAEWEAYREPCKRLGTAIDDGSIYEIALRAANAGDRDAATCYIMTRWTMPKDPTFKGQAVGHTQMGISPQFLSDYRKNARRLFDEGLQRGDWRVVSLMDMAINDRHGQLIGSLRSFDSPNDEYVNLKLMLLGTRGDKLQEASRRVEFALQQVPASQVAAANARAQAMYDAHFADKGPYEWGFGGCR